MSETIEPTLQLTGREKAESLMRQERRAGITALLDFTLTEVADGRVVFEGAPSAAVYNPMGTVHGGYAATLLDSACGIAVLSKLTADQGFTTLELKVSYHRAMTHATGPVRAEAKVVTMGRRTAFTEATLTDAAGRLYATATSTLLVFER